MAISTPEPSLHCSGEESPEENLVLCGAGYIICSLHLQVNQRKNAEKHPKHETLCAGIFSSLTLFLLFPSGLPLTLSAGSFLISSKLLHGQAVFFSPGEAEDKDHLSFFFCFLRDTMSVLRVPRVPVLAFQEKNPKK